MKALSEQTYDICILLLKSCAPLVSCARAETPDQEDEDTARGCRNSGVHSHLCGHSPSRGAGHAQGRARVEAVPASFSACELNLILTSEGTEDAVSGFLTPGCQKVMPRSRTKGRRSRRLPAEDYGPARHRQHNCMGGLR